MATKYSPQILLEVPNRLPPARTHAATAGPRVLQHRSSSRWSWRWRRISSSLLLCFFFVLHHIMAFLHALPQHRQALAWAGQPVGFTSTRVDVDCRRVSSELMAGAVSLLYLYRSVDHAAQNNSLLLVGHTIYSALAWQEWDTQC